MFCTRKIHALSLLLLTATTMRGTERERELSFNTDRREERRPIDSSTGLKIIRNFVFGGAVSMAAKKCMPLDNDKAMIYQWTKDTMITPHDVNAIAQISTISLTFAAFCEPDKAKQFKEFAVRAPIAGIVYALTKSEFAQEFYGYIPIFGDALKKPTDAISKKYPLAGDMTSGVIAIATYKALDPAISYACKRVSRWWHGVYNESTDTQVNSSDYKKVL
jgi:hypothetical protein